MSPTARASDMNTTPASARPAVTSPSTWRAVDDDASGVRCTPFARSSASVAEPHVLWSVHSAMRRPGAPRSASVASFLGLPGAVATTRRLLANGTGMPEVAPASLTRVMLAGSPEAKTSASAPWASALDRSDDPEKTNWTE